MRKLKQFFSENLQEPQERQFREVMNIATFWIFYTIFNSLKYWDILVNPTPIKEFINEKNTQKTLPSQIEEISAIRPIDEYVLNPLTKILQCDAEFLHSHPFIRAYLKMRMRKDSVRPLIYLNLAVYTGLVILLTGLTYTFSIPVLKSYFIKIKFFGSKN